MTVNNQVNHAISGEIKSDLMVAIDGPSASGKTTAGRAIAARLNLLFFDTGLTYRAVAKTALARGVDTDDAAALTAIADGVACQVADGGADAVREVGIVGFAEEDLRDERVSDASSRTSRHAEVRRVLVALQRRTIEAAAGVVAVGRDVGTVVMRDTADFKVYLDAGEAVRARRRSMQSRRNYGVTRHELSTRDDRDTHRPTAPLRPARDALIINTDELELEQVVARILEHITTINEA